METQQHIHKSIPKQAEALTQALYESRSHWNYPSAYAEASKPLLRVTPEFIEKNHVYHLLDGDAIIGFYSFVESKDGIELNNFWVIPEAIGKGYGRMLWEHALELTEEQGWDQFFILPDPEAEGFYLRMGAIPVGDRVPSRLPDGPLFQKMIVSLSAHS